MKSDNQPVVSAPDRILVSGLDDWEPLADIDWCVRQDNPELPLPEIQNKTLATIRSLVANGLCVLGTVPPHSGFIPVSDFERAMTELATLYIGQYDTREWRYAYWLNLTDSGDQLANKLYDANPQAYAENDED